MTARDADAVAAFRDAVLAAAHGRCQAGTRIASVDLDAGRACTGWADHAHHVLPRGMGGHSAHDPDLGVAVCDCCHRYIHAHPAVAYALGLLRRHGHTTPV